MKPSHLGYAIDDLRAGGAGYGQGGFERSRAGDIAAGHRPAVPPSLRYGAASQLVVKRP